MKRLNAAIIGVSGFGQAHYYMLLEQIAKGNMNVAAATVINQEQEPVKCGSLKALGAELFNDYRQMLEKYKGKLDICFIPTGIHLHAPMTIAALETGANVYVEKPVASVIQEVKAMQAAANKNKRFIAVGYQNMYQPELLKIKKQIHDALGGISLIKACDLGSRNTIYYNRNTWAGRVISNGRWVLDGPFHNAGAHTLNLMCFLAGEKLQETALIESVNAELYRTMPIESCDVGILDITTKTKSRILFYSALCMDNSLTLPSIPAMIIRGPNGFIEYNNKEMILTDKNENRKILEIPSFRLGTAFEIMEAVNGRLMHYDMFIYTPELAGTEVICANGAFESSTINDIAMDCLYHTNLPNGSKMTAIKDFNKIITIAYNEEKMFSDCNICWANPGEKILMNNYCEFRGGKTGKQV